MYSRSTRHPDTFCDHERERHAIVARRSQGANLHRDAPAAHRQGRFGQTPRRSSSADRPATRREAWIEAGTTRGCGACARCRTRRRPGSAEARPTGRATWTNDDSPYRQSVRISRSAAPERAARACRRSRSAENEDRQAVAARRNQEEVTSTTRTSARRRPTSIARGPARFPDPPSGASACISSLGTSYPDWRDTPAYELNLFSRRSVFGTSLATHSSGH